MTDENEGFPLIDWDALSAQMSKDMPDEALPYVLTPAQIRNRIVRDVVPCSQVDSVSQMLGIQPTSPEVADMEHRESHSRLDATKPLEQAVGMMALFAAEAATGAILDATGEQVLGRDMAEATVKLQPVVFMSAIAIIAELLDAGYVHLPHGGVHWAGVAGDDE